MRRIFVIFLALWLLMFLPPCFAQGQEEGSRSIEILLRMMEDEASQAQLQEHLERLLLAPLDLNSADKEELGLLPLMDDFFIRNLLLERSRRGGFKSVYELKEVQGAPSQLYLLEPFLTVVQPEEADDRSSVSLSLVTESDVTDFRNSGGAFRAMGESNRHLSWVLVGEQDRGEPFLPLRQGGVDFVSSTVMYRRDFQRGALQVIVGDYKVTTGLGLMLGQATSYFTKMEAQGKAPPLATRTLRPHASFREYHYLSGGGVEWGMRRFRVTLFAGLEPLDARVEGMGIKTLYFTGKHITKAERLHRRTARREVIGGYLSYGNASLHLGVAGMLHRYKSSDGAVLLPPHRYPQAERLGSTAVDFYYLGQATRIFCEATIAPRERMAATLGASYRHDLLGEFTLNGSYSGIQRMDSYGTTLGYSSSGRDDMSVRLAWIGEVARNWTGRIYLEGFTPISERSHNGVANLQLHYRGGRRQAQGRLRMVKLATEPLRWTARWAVQEELSHLWRLRGSANLSQQTSSQLGWALSARAQYGRANALRAELGLHYFALPQGVGVRSDTPYMPLRPYAPMLFGEGLRVVGVLRYPVAPRLHFAARFSHTWYQREPTTPLPSLLNLSLTYHLH